MFEWSPARGVGQRESLPSVANHKEVGMLRHLLAMILGTLLLIGVVGYAWPAQARPADGTVTLDNQRFGVVVLSVDGRQLGEIAPESHKDFRVPAGNHAVRVRTKTGEPVLAQSVVVRPNSAVQLMVVPDKGKLTVRNQTGRDGRLLINGMDRGGLAPGQARVLVLEPGTVSVQIRQAERVLDSARLSLRAGDRKSWSAVAPSTAELRVRNPLPVAVRVRVDDRSPVSIAPGDTRMLRDQPTGSASVVVTLPDGRVLSREQVRIDPFDGGNFMVPLPSEGAVRLVNLGSGTVDVYAEGRRVASISGFDNALVEVPLGTIELTLRDRARNIVLRTAVDVEPFDAVTVRCDLQRHMLTVERDLIAEVDAFIEALRRLAS